MSARPRSAHAEHFAYPEGDSAEVLLYPAGVKESDSEPFSTLANRFSTSLAEAELLVVIGYSFQDQHIRRAVLDRLVTNRSLQVVLVDPSAEQIFDLPREEESSLHFSDFPDRMNPLWTTAKSALEGRLIALRIQEVQTLDQETEAVVRDRSQRSFSLAADGLVKVFVKAQKTDLPGKANRFLLESHGSEFRGALEEAQKRLLRGALESHGANLPPSLTGVGLSSSAGEEDSFLEAMLIWVASSAMGMPETVECANETVKALTHCLLQGVLLFAEDGRLSWNLPGFVDPTAPVFASRVQMLTRLIEHLQAHPFIPGEDLLSTQEKETVEVFFPGTLALRDLLKVYVDADRPVMLAGGKRFFLPSGHMWKEKLLGNARPFLAHRYYELWVPDPQVHFPAAAV